MRVGRAATDLDALDEFYGAGMRCEKTMAIKEDAVETDCYLWQPDANVDLCFVRRPDADTRGPFKTGDYERMLRNATQTTQTARCGVLRPF